VRNRIERLGNIQSNQMYRSPQAISAMKLRGQKVAHIISAVSLAEAKGINTENAIRPRDKASMNNGFADTESGVGQIDGAPIARIKSIALFVDENEFAVIQTLRAVARQALVDQSEKILRNFRIGLSDLVEINGDAGWARCLAQMKSGERLC
jgi:hypothetical protein